MDVRQSAQRRAQASADAQLNEAYEEVARQGRREGRGSSFDYSHYVLDATKSLKAATDVGAYMQRLQRPGAVQPFGESRILGWARPGEGAGMPECVIGWMVDRWRAVQARRWWCRRQASGCSP
jgi:hypothetical protein